MTGSNVPQSLAPGWERGFQPAYTNPVSVVRTDHATFLELGVELEPVFSIGGGWKLGIPVSFPVGGVAIVAGTGGHFYLLDKPVAGTRLDWWDPVLVYATAIRMTSPAVGLSVQRGRIAIRAAVQRYSVRAEDFVGQDCEGCRNTSSVFTRFDLSDGVGSRLDLVVLPADKGHVGAGFFFAKQGSDAWQAGMSLRILFRFGTRS